MSINLVSCSYMLRKLWPDYRGIFASLLWTQLNVLLLSVALKNEYRATKKEVNKMKHKGEIGIILGKRRTSNEGNVIYNNKSLIFESAILFPSLFPLLTKTRQRLGWNKGCHCTLSSLHPFLCHHMIRLKSWHNV